MTNNEELWSKVRYTSPISFIIGRRIIEVDVTKANISILREANRISEDQYRYFLTSDRMERLVFVGNMQAKDESVTALLQNRLKEVRQKIFEIFCIDYSNLLSIRNDAVIFVDNGYRSYPPDLLQITDKYKSSEDITETYYLSQYLKFRVKGLYTSYYKIGNKEILYYCNRITEEEYIDVAGIGDDALNLHRNYFLDLLMTIFESAEEGEIADTIDFLSKVYTRYITKDFDISYYRRFDANSRYDIDKTISNLYDYQLDHMTNDQKRIVTISYNESILRQLQKIYSTIYFMKI